MFISLGRPFDSLDEINSSDEEVLLGSLSLDTSSQNENNDMVDVIPKCVKKSTTISKCVISTFRLNTVSQESITSKEPIQYHGKDRHLKTKRLRRRKTLWNGYLTRFGLSSLKQFQPEAIRAIKRVKSVIVMQKTGSGKSICFQLPSMFDKSKFAVIIFSIVSLISSQVGSQRALGIDAIHL